ncbi:MAG: lactonase family protein [Actinomycetales bacterium]
MSNTDSGVSARFAGVFVQTNDVSANQVLAFRRREDGSLDELDAVATGGVGLGAPHLTSQGSVLVTGDGAHLLVANAGSDDIAVFALEEAGPRLIQTIDAGGRPTSVTEHEGLVYVLVTAEPAVVGFRLGTQGLEPIDESRRVLAVGADPAQVGFSPDGATLLVTQRGTDSIVTFAVDHAGHLATAQEIPSSGPTPYGFTFAGPRTLVVTEAFGAKVGAAAASSYQLGTGLEPTSRSIGNGRSEICWAVSSLDGRYVFTTNFADGAVSRYQIAADGSLVLDDAVAATAHDGQTGLRDEDLSSDGRFLYALDADSQHIFGWHVEADGKLVPVGSWGGLPATVAGLAAS